MNNWTKFDFGSIKNVSIGACMRMIVIVLKIQSLC